MNLELANTRDARNKDDLLRYIEEHPEQRLWQAIRNWSGHGFVMVGELTEDERGNVIFPKGLEDTFYFEGRKARK